MNNSLLNDEEDDLLMLAASSVILFNALDDLPMEHNKVLQDFTQSFKEAVLKNVAHSIASLINISQFTRTIFPK
jgi:hypothetical protein